MHFAKHLIIEAIKMKQKLKSVTFYISCFELADRIELIELGGQHIVNELELVDSKMLKNVNVNLTSDKLLSNDEMIPRFEVFTSGRRAIKNVKLLDVTSLSFTNQEKKSSSQAQILSFKLHKENLK